MRYCLLMLSVLLACVNIYAVQALPIPIVVNQPDGSQLTVKIIGDEFFHYLTTLDGYTIVKSDDGFYRYAQLAHGQVVASQVVAHDASVRSASEMTWLDGIGKHLCSRESKRMSAVSRQQRDRLPSVSLDNFKGLAILVEFEDSVFTRSDVKEFYHRMLNEKGYTGYANEDGTPNAYGNFTGSVRDYFNDNSYGLFDPQFDVVGPVRVPYSVNDGQVKGTEIFISAVKQAHDVMGVDYSNYDLDQDGCVDMIYFIVADSPSSSDPYNPSHLWPHRSSLRYFSNLKYDGKYIGDYACSSEYIYSKSYGIFDGIGTICHEFSHVLGLPDLYDTSSDDDAINGEAQHPGEWELMAGGNYANNARTPVAYSLYDRYSLGFACVKVIEAEGEYELPPIGETGEGFILKTKQEGEMFLIENRQLTKWDAYAPGHGLVVVRMDSTNADAWNNNAPNADARRLYYDMLRAGQSTYFQSSGDPFPGTYGVAMLTNSGKPNLKSWAGMPSDWVLYDIHEDGPMVKFKVKRDGTFNTVVEDFETMAVTSGSSAADVQGSLATWSFAGCSTVTPADTLMGNGAIAVAINKASVLTMTSDVTCPAHQVTFTFYNPSSTGARLQLYVSTDGGETWTQQNSAGGGQTATAIPQKKSVLYFPVAVSKPARYRIACIASAPLAGYLDDFTIYLSDKGLVGDVNGDGEINVADVNLVIGILLDAGMHGDALSRADVNEDGEINIADVNTLVGMILSIL